MRINKIKKAMGLGQIFGIIVVAVVAAFIINRIRGGMNQAENAANAFQSQAKDLLEKKQDFAPEK